MADASTDGWAAEELGQAELGDQRLPALPLPLATLHRYLVGTGLACFRRLTR